MPREFVYTIVLEADPEGGFVVSCRDFPELLTSGSDRADAIDQARDALEEAFAARIRRGEDIPEPSPQPEGQDVYPIHVPPIMAAKAALALALRSRSMSQAALAREAGIDEKEVRRLLDPRHPSKLTTLQRVLHAFDQEVEIRIVERERPEILETDPRSYAEVASSAEGLAAALFPDHVRAGRSLPIHELLSSERLTHLTGQVVRFAPDPSLDVEAQTEYSNGAISMRLRPDVISGAAAGHGRFRFTVAHELAHVLLHRDDLARLEGRALRENVTATRKLPPDVPIYRSPEWQASTWASAFLMPADAVRSYLRELKSAGAEFTVEPFAANFQVSLQAASIRLEKLLPELVAGVPPS
jgi:antitoxin HicB